MFSLGGMLPLAHACPPGMHEAVLRFQKTAQSESNPDTWWLKIVNKTSSFENVRNEGNEGRLSGSEIVRRKLRSALFPDRQSLIYLKKYLAEVKILRKNPLGGALREFKFKGKSYEYKYYYPSSGIGEYENACLFVLSIGMSYPYPDDEWAVTEIGYIYRFDLVDGELKLVSNLVVG
jgi:hypothetical protein